MLAIAFCSQLDQGPARGRTRFLSGINLEQLARQVLEQHCHFRGRAAEFDFVQEDDVLVVRGCVPSFYLRKIVETALEEFNCILRIDNQVDVVSCDGLSSSRDN